MTQMRVCTECGRRYDSKERSYHCPDCKAQHVASPPRAKRGDRLTPREKQMVAQVAAGKSNKDIAADMGITTGTVKVYLSKIYLKIGVNNRTQLAVWAKRLGGY